MKKAGQAVGGQEETPAPDIIGKLTSLGIQVANQRVLVFQGLVSVDQHKLLHGSQVASQCLFLLLHLYTQSLQR